jgi:hypothetical protein
LLHQKPCPSFDSTAFSFGDLRKPVVTLWALRTSHYIGEPTNS